MGCFKEAALFFGNFARHDFIIKDFAFQGFQCGHHLPDGYFFAEAFF